MKTTLARIAIGVLAVHVVDDNFVNPQPGMSAGDHLVSGLVPVALLGLAAWGYPRLRPGSQALLTLVLGVLGVAAGSEFLHYAPEVGASGDDYTSLLSIPAGLLLVGVGVATLWSSRKREGSRARRYARRALIAVVGFFGFTSLVVPLVVIYVATHNGRTPVERIDLGAPAEKASFTTSDGLDLEGSYVPSRNGAAVIVFPGRAASVQRHAKLLVRHGYGVLAFDRRGEGDSEGEPNGFGWGGDRDLTAAVAYLKDRPDVEPGRIGGIGLSVGGEMLLQEAAENEDIAAVVSEGAGSRSVGEYVEMPGGVGKWLTVPTEVVLTTGNAVFSNQAPPPRLEGVVGRIAPRAVFFIWAGDGVDTEILNPEYHDAAKEPKEIWKLEDSGHVGALKKYPREYERRVMPFLDRALSPAH